jgi:uncharacterized protein (DUF433 family)
MRLPDFLTQDADGEIHMTGHRIGIYTVVRVYKEGYSAEQIAEEFPSLPLDLIQKALAFYHENLAEVDAYVDAYRAELLRQEAAPRKGPSLDELKQRWQAMGLGELP